MSTYNVTNPFTNQTVATISWTTRDEAFKALELLSIGKRKIAKLTPHERSTILYQLAELMKKNQKKIATQITLEMGKTIGDSLVEMERATNTVFCAAEETRRIHGEVLNSDAYLPKRNKRGMTEHFPLGIIFAITPFNFPINLSVHKIAPAFAAGNAILFKPGPQNILSAKMLVELCYEAGMTQEMIQLINPEIPTMSELIKHPEIQCINFTGGIVAAKAIAANAGYKKLLFELGGNDPLIVMPDADISLAVKTAINQRFGTAGQRCTACKKLFIHESVYEQFKNLLISESQKLTMGDPMDPSVFIGPVVNEKAALEIEKRIQEAIKMGAKLLLGGKREGAIIHPTILENVSETCELVADETFGPVMPLKTFKHIDEVIQTINQSRFGLQSGVFTNDLSIVKKLFDELEVGALAVNDGPGFRAEHFPFGGVKESGIGREGVRYAIEEMSYIKTLIF
jgi:acyl-CoA reductase-like NAD-dependent aldehyde dehydrogenase